MALEVESPEELGYGSIRNNLSESSVSDRQVGELGVDLARLTLLYGPHRGEPALCELIAAQSGWPDLPREAVLTTAGAAGALFIIATSLLGPDSHLVVVRPNYATNIETPRAIGCEITYLDLKFESQFRLDPGEVEAALRPNTAYISLTCPHNPTGQMLPWQDLERIGHLAERHGCRVLVDETYRDLAYGAPYRCAAGISDRFISVSSVSKAYGIPGVRAGWLVTRDAKLQTLFLAAKEQIGICGSVIDEALALAALRQRDTWLPASQRRNREHLARVADWVRREPRVEWVPPVGGVVCFPRLRVGAGFSTARFYASLLDRHGTYVGPGHWFEQPDSYMRIGFAWPTREQLAAGLAGISAALDEQAA